MATVEHASPSQSNGISDADQQGSPSMELTLASATSFNGITSEPLGLQLGDDGESGALMISPSEMASLTLRREEAADRERALARKTSERRDHFDKVAARVVDNARSLVTLLEDELKQSASPDTIQSGHGPTPALEILHLLSEQVDTLFHLALEVQVTESALLQEHKEVSQLHHSAVYDENIARFRMGAMALQKRLLMYHNETLEHTNRTFTEATAAKDELIGTLKQKASQSALKHGLFKSQIEELSKEKQSLEVQLRDHTTNLKNCQAALEHASARERDLSEELHRLQEQLTEAHESAATSQETFDTRRKELEGKIEELEATLATSANDLTKAREKCMIARNAHEAETTKLKDALDVVEGTLLARQSDLERAQEEAAVGRQREQALATLERENKALQSEKAELSTALVEVQTQLSKAYEDEAKASGALERHIGEVEAAARSSIATLEQAHQETREARHQLDLWKSKHAEYEQSTKQTVENEISQRQAAEALAMQLKMENKKLRAELEHLVSENKVDRRKSIDHKHQLEAQLASLSIERDRRLQLSDDRGTARDSSDSQKAIADLKAEVERLQGVADDWAALAEDAAKSIVIHEEDYKRSLETVVDQAEDQKSSLKAHNERLRTQFDTLSGLSALQKECSLPGNVTSKLLASGLHKAQPKKAYVSEAAYWKSRYDSLLRKVADSDMLPALKLDEADVSTMFQ